jgi:hypothetical protein
VPCVAVLLAAIVAAGAAIAAGPARATVLPCRESGSDSHGKRGKHQEINNDSFHQSSPYQFCF